MLIKEFLMFGPDCVVDAVEFWKKFEYYAERRDSFTFRFVTDGDDGMSHGELRFCGDSLESAKVRYGYSFKMTRKMIRKLYSALLSFRIGQKFAGCDIGFYFGNSDNSSFEVTIVDSDHSRGIETEVSMTVSFLRERV